MLLWLRNLRVHTFEPRHFENIGGNGWKNQGNLKREEKLSKVNDNIDELQSNAIEDSSKKHDLESVYIEEEPTAKKKKTLD